MSIFKSAAPSNFKTILNKDDQTFLCRFLIKGERIESLAKLILFKPKFDENYVASQLFKDNDFSSNRVFCLSLMIKMGYKKLHQFFSTEEGDPKYFIQGILSVFNKNEIKMADLLECGMFSDLQLQNSEKIISDPDKFKLLARTFYHHNRGGEFNNHFNNHPFDSISDEKLNKYIRKDLFLEDDLEAFLLDALNLGITSADSLREFTTNKQGGQYGQYFPGDNAFSRALAKYDLTHSL